MAAAVAAAVVAISLPSVAEAKFFGGVVPDLPSHAHASPTARAHAANLPYDGGKVLHSNHTHLIFWQPSGSGLTFDPGYESLIETFLDDVAADSRKPTNVYGLSGQYQDPGGPAAYDSTYVGAVVANDPLPRNGCTEPLGPPLGTGPGWHYCLDDQQMQAEIVHVVLSDHLPQSGRDVYFLIVPNGLGSCEFSGPSDCALGGGTVGSYCGYHSTTPDGLPYAVIPYNAVRGHCQSGNPRPNASTADPTISTLSHEHNEMVTDPYGDAWIDTSFQEDGDLCIESFGPDLGGAGSGAYNEVIHGHRYYLQEEWSNENSSCQPRDETDRVSFRIGSGRLHAGSRVGATARAGDQDGSIVSYDWWFGDGRRGHNRRTSHMFRRPGRYRAVLRVTDSAGNWAFYTRTVRVSSDRGG